MFCRLRPTQKPELENHCERKHAAFGFDVSFPDYGKAKEAPKESKYAPDKEKKEKKKKYKKKG